MPFATLDRLIVPAPDPNRVGWLRDWEYAHRGLHRDGVPENSLAAFASAMERGMGVECDIQRSRDGCAMLLHDWELDRLTGVSGPTADHSAEDLAQIAFLDSEHKLARLEDLLPIVGGAAPILVEIKSRRGYDVARSCRAVADTLQGYAGKHAVMSFDPRVSAWFAEHSPRDGARPRHARGRAWHDAKGLAAACGVVGRAAGVHRLPYCGFAQRDGRIVAGSRHAGADLDGEFAPDARTCEATCRCPDLGRGRAGVSSEGLAARVAGSVGSIDAAAWNALAGDNPFMRHEFLTAMEDLGSVGPGTGWQSVPIVVSADGGPPLAAMPAYAKSHSQGEYVFDHAFADAYERAGGDYYPKLQIAAPFTPATGPRLLLSDASLARPLLSAAEQLCLQSGLSSAHATFIEPDQVPMFEEAGWLLRTDIQFHWVNRGFSTFDDFPRHAHFAQTQGFAKGTAGRAGRCRDRASVGRRHSTSSLGCLLALLSGHGLAQMGQSLS